MRRVRQRNGAAPAPAPVSESASAYRSAAVSGRLVRSGARATAAMVALVTALSGCALGAVPEPAPTGTALRAQAEQHYRDYRAVTTGVQELIYDGAWDVEVASFGMQPSAAGCRDGSYRFDLTRSTTIDPAAQDRVSADVREYLEDEGFQIEEQNLGSGTAQSRDLIVRDQGDFSRLMVTFIANGAVLVTAATVCWPGERNELSALMFGGVTLSEGYLPRTEAPGDPLFFGVTPGEPGFAPAPIS